MKTYAHKPFLYGKSMIVIAIIASSTSFMSFNISNESAKTVAADDRFPVKDSIASVKAFKVVYDVLMSPCCMNCHHKGDVPLQGDDSHLHNVLPKRGKNENGSYAMKCKNCHQPENIPGLHKPPGNPKWAL